jgi:hypothetical protein
MSVKRKRATVDGIFESVRFQDNLRTGKPWSKIKRFMNESIDIDNAEAYCEVPILVLCIEWITGKTRNGTANMTPVDVSNYVELVDFCVLTGMTMESSLNAPFSSVLSPISFVCDIFKASAFVKQPINVTVSNEKTFGFLLDVSSVDQCKKVAPLTSNQVDQVMFNYDYCQKTRHQARKFAHILKDDLDTYFIAVCAKECCEERADWYKLQFCSNPFHNNAIEKHIEKKRLDVQAEIVEFFSSSDIIPAIANIVCSFFQNPTVHVCCPKKVKVTTHKA